MHLTDFVIQQAPYAFTQQQGLAHLLKMHCVYSQPELHAQLQERIAKVCCKEPKIKNRHFVISEQWFTEKRGFGDRNRCFQQIAEEVFTKFYPVDSKPPEELIHVTCTGYYSPSAAQLITSKRGWKETQVIHAYHMGCMAALPAIRMASGFARSGKKHVDMVHTEMCSLHLNPELHSDEQLVAQSLFADGFIKYSLLSDPPHKSSLQLLAVHEELIANTETKMKWECEDWGLKMTLSRDIPLLIGQQIVPFLNTLEKKAGISLADAYFAIHPGGPKIIESVAKQLKLADNQFSHSESILNQYGNMSSATLPHIWASMLSDTSIPTGSRIASLAFGPGLCIAGCVFKKEA